MFFRLPPHVFLCPIFVCRIFRRKVFMILYSIFTCRHFICIVLFFFFRYIEKKKKQKWRKFSHLFGTFVTLRCLVRLSIYLSFDLILIWLLLSYVFVDALVIYLLSQKSILMFTNRLCPIHSLFFISLFYLLLFFLYNARGTMKAVNY